MHISSQVSIAEKLGDGQFLRTKTSRSLSLLSHGASSGCHQVPRPSKLLHTEFSSKPPLVRSIHPPNPTYLGFYRRHSNLSSLQAASSISLGTRRMSKRQNIPHTTQRVAKLNVVLAGESEKTSSLSLSSCSLIACERHLGPLKLSKWLK